MTSTDPDSRLERVVTKLVQTIQPSPDSVRKSVASLRAQRHRDSHRELASAWTERVCRRYAAEGAASALPAVFPGMGTTVQLAIDGGTIALDLAYMLRCMADIVMGVGHIVGREVEDPFNEEFVRVLGFWCGALSLGKEAAIRVGTKLAFAQAKRVPQEVFKRLNQDVSRRILMGFGARRGSLLVGRLLPFGVGAVIGGGFNYATMRSFRDSTLKYYAT